jgi:phosphate transport system substrate-binding protein
MSKVQKMSRIAALALACAVGWSGCSSQDTGSRIVVTGASTIAPLMGEIGRRFEQTHPGVRVDVQTGGSSRGVADARKGLSDIGMASRPAKADESDLQWFPIALDGVALILHSSNPVKELSADQVRAIYRGEIQNWSELGGADLPITVVNKAEGRSTLELFLAYFKLEATEIKPDVVIGDNQQGIKTVSSDPAAIGYVSIGTAEFEIKRGTTLQALPLEGVAASIDTVRAGRFALSRPLNLVTSAAPEGLAKELIEFARSPEVRDLIEAQFFVPLDSAS